MRAAPHPARLLLASLVALGLAALATGCSTGGLSGSTSASEADATASAVASETAPPHTPTPTPTPAPASRPSVVGRFDLTSVPEASGLAASRSTPGALYVLNDDTGGHALDVVGADGAPLGALEVLGLSIVDGEALDVGPCPPGGGASCVTIGDIGDNVGGRDEILLYRFPEPDLAAGVGVEPVASEVLRVRYPDGPHNAEALFTDDDGRPWVVTKAPFDRETGIQGETRAYRLDDPAGGVLTDMGPLHLPPARLPLLAGAVGSVVTGADARRGAVVLRTYDAVFLYAGPSVDAATEGFRDWPVRELTGPRLGQTEAVAFSAAADGCPVLTTAEGTAQVWSVPC